MNCDRQFKKKPKVVDAQFFDATLNACQRSVVTILEAVGAVDFVFALSFWLSKHFQIRSVSSAPSDATIWVQGDIEVEMMRASWPSKSAIRLNLGYFQILSKLLG